MAFRAGTKSYSVYDEQRRHRTGTSCSHIEYRAGAVGREELVNSIPVLTPEYLLPSKWIPVLAPTYSLPSKYLLTLHQSMQRTYPISDAPLLKLALGSFAPLQKSRQKTPFLCVNRSPIRNGFLRRRKGYSVKCEDSLKSGTQTEW